MHFVSNVINVNFFKLTYFTHPHIILRYKLYKETFFLCCDFPVLTHFSLIAAIQEYIKYVLCLNICVGLKYVATIKGCGTHKQSFRYFRCFTKIVYNTLSICVDGSADSNWLIATTASDKLHHSLTRVRCIAVVHIFGISFKGYGNITLSIFKLIY